MQSFYFYFI